MAHHARRVEQSETLACAQRVRWSGAHPSRLKCFISPRPMCALITFSAASIFSLVMTCSERGRWACGALRTPRSGPAKGARLAGQVALDDVLQPEEGHLGELAAPRLEVRVHSGGARWVLPPVGRLCAEGVRG